MPQDIQQKKLISKTTTKLVDLGLECVTGVESRTGKPREMAAAGSGQPQAKKYLRPVFFWSFF